MYDKITSRKAVELLLRRSIPKSYKSRLIPGSNIATVRRPADRHDPRLPVTIGKLPQLITRCSVPNNAQTIISNRHQLLPGRRPGQCTHVVGMTIQQLMNAAAGYVIDDGAAIIRSRSDPFSVRRKAHTAHPILMSLQFVHHFPTAHVPKPGLVIVRPGCQQLAIRRPAYRSYIIILRKLKGQRAIIYAPHIYPSLRAYSQLTAIRRPTHRQQRLV